MARRRVCLLIALAALRWIVALLISTDRAGDIPIPVRSQEGTTILQPAALTGALTREIGTYHGVDTARGRIIGDASAPEIVIAVTASQSADLHALHRRIETEALAHTRQALGKPTCRSTSTLTSAAPRTVRDESRVRGRVRLRSRLPSGALDRGKEAGGVRAVDEPWS